MANHVTTFSLAASTDDGWGSPNSTAWNDTTTIPVNRHYTTNRPVAVFRLTITGVEQGSTINHARLRVRVYSAAGTDYAGSLICVENNLSPAAFAANTTNAPGYRINPLTGSTDTPNYSLCTTNGTARYLANVWVTDAEGAINNSSVGGGDPILRSVDFASLLQPLVTNASWNSTSQVVVVSVVGGSGAPAGASLYGKSHGSAINTLVLDYDDPATATVTINPTPVAAKASFPVARIPPYVKYTITYTGDYTSTYYSGGMTVDLFIPPPSAGPVPAGGWPVALWIHGGRFVAGDRDDTNENGLSTAWRDALLASNVVVASADYPLSIEQLYFTALDYNKGPSHPVAIKSVKTCMKYLQTTAATLYNLNPAKFILSGHSAGTHIALSAALSIGDDTTYTGIQNEAPSNYWDGSYTIPGGRNNYGTAGADTLSYQFNYKPWGGTTGTAPAYAVTHTGDLTASEPQAPLGVYLYAPVIDLTAVSSGGLLGTWSAVQDYMGRNYSLTNALYGYMRGEGDINRYIDPTINDYFSPYASGQLNGGNSIYTTARGTTKRLPTIPIVVNYSEADTTVPPSQGVVPLYNVLNANGITAPAVKQMSGNNVAALSARDISTSASLLRVALPAPVTGHENVTFYSATGDFLTFAQKLYGFEPLATGSVAAATAFPAPTLTGGVAPPTIINPTALATTASPVAPLVNASKLSNLGSPIHVDASVRAYARAEVGRVSPAPITVAGALPAPHLETGGYYSKTGPTVRTDFPPQRFIGSSGTEILWLGNTTGGPNGGTVMSSGDGYSNFTRVYNNGGTMVWNTALAIEGTTCIKHTSVGGTATASVQRPGINTGTTLYMRFYLRVESITQAYYHCVAALDDTIENDQGGKLRLTIHQDIPGAWTIGGYGTRDSVVADPWNLSAPSFALNQWYAFEWKVVMTGATWTQQLRVTKHLTGEIVASNWDTPRTISGTSTWLATGARWGLVIPTPANATVPFVAYTDGHALSNNPIPLLDANGSVNPSALAVTTTAPAPEVYVPANLVNEDFDGGSNGAAVTTTTTTADDVNGNAGGTLTHSTTQYINSPHSARVDGTAYRLAQWSLADRADTYMSFYFWMSSNPTVSSHNVVEIRDAATNTTALAQLNIDTSGRFRCRNGVTAVPTGSSGWHTLTTGQWYRADWQIHASGSQQVRLYTGATLHSATTSDAVYNSGVYATTYTGGNQGGVLLGMTQASTVTDFFIDRVRVDSASMPLPFGASAPAGSTVNPAVLAATTTVPAPRALLGDGKMGPSILESVETISAPRALLGDGTKSSQSLGAVAVAIPTPTLKTQGIVNPSALATTAVLAAYQPTLKSGTVVNPGTLAATAKLVEYAPTKAGGGLLTPTPLAATTATFGRVGGVIQVPTLAATTSFPVPMTTGNIVWFSSLTGTDGASVTVGDGFNNLSFVSGSVQYETDVVLPMLGTSSVRHGT